MCAELLAQRVGFFARTASPFGPTVKRSYMHWSDVTVSTSACERRETMDGSRQDDAAHGCSCTHLRPSLSWSRESEIMNRRCMRPCDSWARLASGLIRLAFKFCQELKAVHGGLPISHRGLSSLMSRYACRRSDLLAKSQGSPLGLQVLRSRAAKPSRSRFRIRFPAKRMMLPVP